MYAAITILFQYLGKQMGLHYVRSVLGAYVTELLINQKHSEQSTLYFPLASDYGVRLPILRSSPEDQILYQTERYNEDTFGYEVPIREEGDYILVMKYAEVYFAQSQQKVWQPSNQIIIMFSV